MSLKTEIKELRNKLEDLEKEYMETTPVCMNKKCSFWKETHKNKCSWTVLIEDCKDYDCNEPKECLGCGKDLSELDEYYQTEGRCEDCI